MKRMSIETSFEVEKERENIKSTKYLKVYLDQITQNRDKEMLWAFTLRKKAHNLDHSINSDLLLMINSSFNPFKWFWDKKKCFQPNISSSK